MLGKLKRNRQPTRRCVSSGSDSNYEPTSDDSLSYPPCPSNTKKTRMFFTCLRINIIILVLFCLEGPSRSQKNVYRAHSKSLSPPPAKKCVNSESPSRPQKTFYRAHSKSLSPPPAKKCVNSPSPVTESVNLFFSVTRWGFYYDNM